ncbi:glycosyltransferase family 39 protein [Sporolactobacillus spathodeae]|uniref:Gpi18-like mannosyltransferase n=1 Tax=Sporolactobacillus spathodeae TaxID=1465502 RepID=A0ABS2Q8B2_9BACL|nr:glycosyltransferase family 39 protein [Sporolactobacillus spathodeae]MBM7658030.1 Gpi18-like mannosyltransferase [Sporolactobacillus spathodeae]
MKSEKQRLITSLILLVVLLAAAAIVSVAAYQRTATKQNVNGGRTGLITGSGLPGTNAASNKGSQPPSTQKHSMKNGAPKGYGKNGQTSSFYGKRSGTAMQQGSRANGNGFAQFGRRGTSSAQTTAQQIVVGVYGLLFLVVCASWLFLKRHRKILDDADSTLTGWFVFAVLATGFLARLAIAPWISGHMDLSLFQNWAQMAASHLFHVYQKSSIDYPPLYLYVLFVIGKLATLPGLTNGYTWLLKLPAILCDCLTAWLLYRTAKRLHHEKAGWALLVIYLFNPAVAIDSTVWGQVDSVFTLLIVLAVTLLTERKFLGASIVFALSVVMKPQGLIFLPVLAYVLMKDGKIIHWLKSMVAFLATIVLVTLPFSFQASGGAFWLIRLMRTTVSEYPFASVNAFNFFSLIGGNYQAQSAVPFLLSYQVWGFVAIILVSILSLWIIWKRGGSKAAATGALIQISGVFTFASGMHERYLFPAIALALLAFLYLKNKAYLYLAIGFSITNFLNIFIVYYGSMNNEMTIGYHWPLILTSFCNVILFFWLLWLTLRGKEVPALASVDQKPIDRTF